MMQQGVLETPIYNGFMLKGGMDTYEQKMNTRINQTYESADSKSRNDLVRAHQRVQVRGGAT